MAVYLKRKIDAVLAKWKADPDHLPLIVRGARQVGKTASIEKFAGENYSNVIEINFATMPEYKQIVEHGYTVDAIIKDISDISRINTRLKFVPHALFSSLTKFRIFQI